MARGDVYQCYFNASQIKPAQLTMCINLPIASRSSTNGPLLSLDKQLLFSGITLAKFWRWPDELPLVINTKFHIIFCLLMREGSLH